MKEPSKEKWLSVLQQLPKDKATGPNQISNEMLQHLGDHSNNVLYKFVCACIRLNNIPDAWRKANIYPIPKPKPWECLLTNTQPITLLDTTRKALIRLLNNRLTSIFVKHSV